MISNSKKVSKSLALCGTDDVSRLSCRKEDDNGDCSVTRFESETLSSLVDMRGLVFRRRPSANPTVEEPLRFSN
jgi:hypothetical protein